MGTSPSRPKDKFDIFQIIDELTDQRPFSMNEVSSILKVKLRKAEKTNRYFDFYELDQGSDIIKAVDLRLPNEYSDKKDGMLIIEFSDSLKISLDDLYSRYGKEGWSFSPAPPNAPLQTPHYHSKIIKEQEVIFGIDRNKPYRLISLIIDRIK